MGLGRMGPHAAGFGHVRPIVEVCMGVRLLQLVIFAERSHGYTKKKG